MKKQLLLFVGAISSFTSVFAQITITSSNVPTAGETYYLGKDTTVTSYGAAGANQTWNFSTWSNQKGDTMNFLNPSTLLGASNFPSSNIGVKQNNASAFFQTSSTEFNVLGFYDTTGGTPISFSYIPAQKFLTFPSTYQTNFNGSSRSVIQIPMNGQFGMDSLRIIENDNYSSTIDGFGTITTPSTNAASALRQKYTENKIDSTYGLISGTTTWMALGTPTNDTTFSYRWWTNAQHYPVAEVETNSKDSITSAQFLVSSTVGIKEASKENSISIYPNPATDKVNISGITNESYMLVFDVNGKLIEHTQLKKNASSINTSNYQNGVYFYQITSSNGKNIFKGKFVIEK